MLAQVESALMKERDEIEIQRGRLEGMALLGVASSQSRAILSHNRRLSQQSLSSEIPDLILPHPFHVQKLNLPQNFLGHLLMMDGRRRRCGRRAPAIINVSTVLWIMFPGRERASTVKAMTQAHIRRMQN